MCGQSAGVGGDENVTGGGLWQVGDKGGRGDDGEDDVADGDYGGGAIGFEMFVGI